MTSNQKKKLIDRQVQNAQNHPTREVDVLQYLYDHRKEEYFMAWEVVHSVNSQGVRLSHRAPARLSDLAEYSPQLVESERIGRFTRYRLRVENVKLIRERLKTK